MKKDARTPSGKLKASRRFPIVGVGASAGGLEAFTQLLRQLPTTTGMGFVLIQHLDPVHESELTRLLAHTTSMPTREAKENLRVKPNHVYVIPPNANLSIVAGVLKLQPRPEGRAPHRSIDFFLQALAHDQQERAIGVVLSGTGTDGTLGLGEIKSEGGITFAQDDSAKHDAMPRSAIAAGCADFVLSPEEIADELARIAAHPYVADATHEPPAPDQASGRRKRMSGERERETAVSHQDDDAALPSGGHGTPRVGARQAHEEALRGTSNPVRDEFGKILLILHAHCGVDFSLYKSSTIQRRVTRRMVLSKHATPQEYATFLKGNVAELDTLFSDVLISVTSFFRNPEAFDSLKDKVFPALLERWAGSDPVRVWVLGCSTGQEAYSIAMAFAEFSDQLPRVPKLQVFATDLNNALLDKARQGLYAKTLAQDLSPDRLSRFFLEEPGGYRVIKSLREQIVFARQNLIGDPPFSRMDLISCRNLLIYLEPGLQKKILPSFHYALRPDGFLFLGASESVGQFTDLFEVADKKQKIFRRKAAPAPAFQLPLAGNRDVYPPRERVVRKARSDDIAPAGLTAQREADRYAITQFAPPGVLVDDELQILQFRGATGAYLEPPTGRASFDLLKMVRRGLAVPLRAAIDKARKENRTVCEENLRVESDGGTQRVTIEVVPLKNVKERCFLILFQPSAAAAKSAPRQAPAAASKRRSPREESQRIGELESELAELRDYHQALQEQSESASEELQASNEEGQSANEELQSINEELETSKEELQSTNEELTTVNEEMGTRNAELYRLNADLTNLQSSIPTAVVLLSRDLTIRRFTTAAEKIFNLLATDIGRPFSAIRHDLTTKAPLGEDTYAQPTGRRTYVTAFPLETVTSEVIDRGSAHEAEVQDRDGRWYRLGIRPYVTVDKNIDGAVLTLSDIDGLKRSEQDAKHTEVLLLDADHRKDEFLATLAHELRNPLAPISNAAQILRMTPTNAVAVRAASEMMLRQIDHMTRLIDDLLDASRITRGRVELRRGRVDVVATVQQAIDSARSVEKDNREFALALPVEPVFVHADPLRLMQIVENLLSNARKFTDRTGHIDVSVERQGNDVSIRVRDDGIGMPPEQIPRIFEMFTQLDTSAERATSGLGIGLALAERLVRMHDGTLNARSAGRNSGSEFVVRLPILDDASHMSPLTSPAADAPVMSGRRILIADDNHDAAETLATLLQLAGNTTHIASNGLEAVQAAEAFKPHIALLDIGMPHLNGYEAARRIREQPCGADVILIALTGWGHEEDRKKSKDAGFDGHLTKPSDYAAIAGMVATSQADIKR